MAQENVIIQVSINDQAARETIKELRSEYEGFVKDMKDEAFNMAKRARLFKERRPPGGGGGGGGGRSGTRVGGGKRGMGRGVGPAPDSFKQWAWEKTKTRGVSAMARASDMSQMAGSVFWGTKATAKYMGTSPQAIGGLMKGAGVAAAAAYASEAVTPAMLAGLEEVLPSLVTDNPLFKGIRERVEVMSDDLTMVKNAVSGTSGGFYDATNLGIASARISGDFDGGLSKAYDNYFGMFADYRSQKGVIEREFKKDRGKEWGRMMGRVIRKTIWNY